MSYKTVIYKKESAIAILQINRPEVLNAINEEVLEELVPVTEDIINDDSIRVVILKGNENAFAAGADIKNFVDYSPQDAHRYISRAHAGINKLFNLTKPTIASIAGYTLGGGCELAMACDIRIAADNAFFGLPEINLGIFPGGGGTQRLSRLIGEGKAKELIFLGEIFDSQKALELGLINRLVPLAQLEEKTLKIASKLSKKPPLAVQAAKELIHLSSDVDIVTGLRMEKEKFAYLFSTEDQHEGMSAFLEGRKAAFKGK